MLNPTFRDILLEFIAASVEFVVVGAYAMAAHGHLRATGDIDLFVRSGEENAQRVITALARFGAPMDQIAEEDFYTPGVVFQIGVPPYRVDVTTRIDGVTFEEVWLARVEVEFEGILMPVIGREHLLRNKQAAGRPKDLIDVKWLEKQQTG